MLFDDELKALLEKVKTIAVIGAKDKPGQAVDMVGRYLIGAGYEVIPVHPKRENVWGLPTYRTLTEVPVAVDLVDVFRAPEFCPAHARETVALESAPLAFWMQLGIASREATDILSATPTRVIQDSCLKVVHERLFK